MVLAVALALAAGVFGGPLRADAEGPGPESEYFRPSRSVADYVPKGPSRCFRLFNVDWSWIGRRTDELPELLSRADPARFAEFCQGIRLDGTIVMAVPHHGYCTYETKLGTKFPGMKGDWFGRTIEELHKRRIAAFGYVTLNWNWKYLRENQGRDFVQAKPHPDGSIDGVICLNAPGYLELVEGYTREVIENYPVDGMRWDILTTRRGCTCAGCKVFYQELYRHELTGWTKDDGRRAMDFYLATTARAVKRLTALCRRIKPSLEIWQNHIQSYAPNDLNLGRTQDVAYNEFGDPFRLLFLKGVLSKEAIITGAMLESPMRRLCMVLGGRGYSYYDHLKTDFRTALPGTSMKDWHAGQVAPFYRMISEIQPYLEGARPVAHLGFVFSENTRFRYPDYDRGPYLGPMQKIAERLLGRSLPPEFVNCLDLADRPRLSRLKLLVLPLTSGLSAGQLEHLREYVRQGGAVLVAGDALRHDERGFERPEFALAGEMGVRFEKLHGPEHVVRVVPAEAAPGPAGLRLPGEIRLAGLVQVRPERGETVLWGHHGKEAYPVLHVSRLGHGKVAYLASLDSVELTDAVVDWLAGPGPVAVTPQGKQVILARQEKEGRWILHLLGEGDCLVDLHRDHAAPTRIVAQYPAGAWTAHPVATPSGLRMRVAGTAADRLLVLE